LLLLCVGAVSAVALSTSACRAVQAWRSDEIEEELERELRAEAEVAISRQSSC
jgi:hypothetical protein